MHKYQRFSVDSAAAVGSLVVRVLGSDHGVLASNPSGAPFHILHFVRDIYFLVSKILSPMWNLEMGAVKERTPKN